MLIILACRPSDNQSDALSAGPDMNAIINWRSVNLGSPALDVTHLSISTRNNVHTIIQPYVKAQATEQSVLITSLALSCEAYLRIVRLETKVGCATRQACTTNMGDIGA